MSNDRFDNPHIDHPALEAFATLAGEFCRLVEEHTSLDPRTFAARLHLLLPQLYVLD